MQNRIRKATLADIQGLTALIKPYVDQEILLPISSDAMERNIREFAVYEQDGRIVACAALRLGFAGLAEIRTLAVLPENQNQGLGKALVSFFLDEAKGMEVKRVFVLTRKTGFFSKLGFCLLDKNLLPQKIWMDCVNCPKLSRCDEVALIKDI